MSIAYRLRNASAEYREMGEERLGDEVHGVSEPENPVLKENFNKLRGDWSIEELRQAMKDKGIDIGTGTLHKMSLGRSGNQLRSLKKAAQFWDVTVDQLLQPGLGGDLEVWPFSHELQKRVAALHEIGRLTLENVMWAHLQEEAPTKVRERLAQLRAQFESVSAPLPSGNVSQTNRKDLTMAGKSS